MKLNLVVIRASDLQQSVAFYESLGLSFVEEKHGSGPTHVACDLDGTVFEIYPDVNVDGRAVRLGFRVSKLDSLIEQLNRIGSPILSPAKDSPRGRRAVVV